MTEDKDALPLHCSAHIQVRNQTTCVAGLPVGLSRCKDTMRAVEMQYGQNATRWQMRTSCRGAEAGGGTVVLGLPGEGSTPAHVKHIFLIFFS